MATDVHTFPMCSKSIVPMMECVNQPRHCLDGCDPDATTTNCVTESFLHLFEEQVVRTPDSIAVEFEGQATSYHTLNCLANQFAHYLKDRGFQYEDRIGICLDRSDIAIISMLGILKSGCAFVPLDPEFPADRLAYIVDHASIKLILCDDDYQHLFRGNGAGQVELISPSSPQLWCKSTDNPQWPIQSSGLAYVMYTSGSTGQPKGVQIEHGSLLTYCLADIDVYRLDESDRTLQFSTLNFDVAIEEIYPPLLVGSTVVVRPRQRSTACIELSDLINSNSITALHIATAYWNEWIDLMLAAKVRVPKSLRLVIVTGEKISVEHYRRWQSLCDQSILWCNAYGPTETTVTCTVFIPTADWAEPQMPIGKPLMGYQAFILNEQLEPIPEGQTGHLYIGGPALARGYLERPDLTDKAFIHTTLPGESNSRRLYRTGDLARWLPSGDIEFSGRVDHQMKIGSYRIEPGEIESVIHLQSNVRESLVICDEVAGQKYLVAYIVPVNPVTAGEIADFLRSRLPSYMIPSRYLFLDQLPKTTNGKVDRAALPPAASAEVARTHATQQASTELEKSLASIMQQVLNIPSLSVDDDFFLLGGSSLLVTRVIAQIADKLSFAIPVRDFFANPTIAALARHIERTTGKQVADRDLERHSQQLRRNLPLIRPLAICSNGCRLHAIRYSPNESTGEFNAPCRQHAVILVPSLGHEYTRAHRNLQQLAVGLSRYGFDTIRFDYAGTGNSDGDPEQLTVGQLIDDIRSIVNFARVQLDFKNVSVLGLRLGATLALRAQLTNLHTMIGWDPILDGRAYYQMIKKFHQFELGSLTKFLSIRKSSATELLGYAWPAALSQGVSSLHLEANKVSEWTRAQANWIVSTKADPSTRLHSLNMQNWQFRTIDDEIYWNDRQFVDAAFASPGLYRCAVELLSEKDR